MDVFETAESSWWMVVEGWQFESGEAPEMEVGGTATFPLEFHWGRATTFHEVGQSSSRRIKENRYKVTAKYSTEEGVPCIDVGVRVPLSLAARTRRDLRAARRGSFATGTVRLGLDITWWPGEPSLFAEDWIILEVLESRSSPASTSSNRQKGWSPVVGPERSSHNLYLVNCQLRRP